MNPLGVAAAVEDPMNDHLVIGDFVVDRVRKTTGQHSVIAVSDRMDARI